MYSRQRLTFPSSNNSGRLIAELTSAVGQYLPFAVVTAVLPVLSRYEDQTDEFGRRKKMSRLLWPDSDCIFDIQPAVLLGPFNVYDREENLGIELSQFDPNDPSDAAALLDQYFLPSVGRWTRQHKAGLLRVLGEALRDPDHDFESYVILDVEDHCAWPDSWQFSDPQRWFKTMYQLLRLRWLQDGTSIDEYS